MVAERISKIRQFLSEDLWKIKLTALSKRRAIAYRFIKVGIITFSEFKNDRCQEKASALTYFSLLSIVPVIAMAFGIATIFGLQDYLQEELTSYFSGQQEVLDYAIGFADKMLSTSSGGLISGISAVFLIYAVARLFNNIEVAFNDIWNTKKGRSLNRMLTDYMSVILLGPILLIMSSSASVFIATSIEKLVESIALLGFIEPVILFLIRLIPFSIIWLLFFLLYVIFPNTSVKVKPALIAGIVAGTLFQFTQYAWAEGQVYLSRYSVIYGAFAALPLFLIWLQLSWTIILLGAELAFSIQNVKNWSFDNESLKMSRYTHRKMMLLVLRHVVKYFHNQNSGISFEDLSGALLIPRRFIREIVDELLVAKLIIQVHSDTSEEVFQPALDINKIDVFMAYKLSETQGMDALPQESENEGYEQIKAVLDEIDQAVKSAPSNKLLKDL